LHIDDGRVTPFATSSIAAPAVQKFKRGYMFLRYVLVIHGKAD
jgi:hypothetical protein